MADKTISAKLDAQGVLHITSLPCINEGENRSVVLQIELQQEIEGASYFLEFKSVRGKKYLSRAVEAKDKTLVYALQNCVLDGAGEAFVQVVARKDDQYIFKSNAAAMRVEGSVNAVLPTQVKQEFVDYLMEFLQKAAHTVDDLQQFKQLLDETNAAMQNTVGEVERRLQDGSFKGDKGDKGEQGDMGPQGEKGDSGFAVWCSEEYDCGGNVAWEVL